MKIFFIREMMAAIVLSLACLPSALAAEVTTMHDSVAATLAYNPTLKASQEYRKAAVHDLQRARSGWFPRVDVRAGYGAEQWVDRNARASNHRATGYSGSRDWYDRSEASLTISQIIWDGMATWNQVNIGKSRLDSAESRLFDNAEGLGLDAVLAHIEIYRQRRIVALAELNVKNHKAILASQHERQRSGASTMADVSQTQTRLARAEASLAESRSALEVALANYKRITGKKVGQIEPPTAPPDGYASLEMALSKSQTGNLKVKALRTDAKTAESRIEFGKSTFHPQIYLEAGPSYSYRTGSSLDDQGGLVVMLYVNWNLFNGGNDWYTIKGDKARARQTRQEIAALLDSLAKDTEITWSRLFSAREQVKSYANAVQYATQTRDMYLEQFNLGQRSLLDVLDSENELFSSSIQLVTAQQNVIAGQYRLLALGGSFLSSFGLDKEAFAVRPE